jgi:hypothetical protein
MYLRQLCLRSTEHKNILYHMLFSNSCPDISYISSYRIPKDVLQTSKPITNLNNFHYRKPTGTF